MIEPSKSCLNDTKQLEKDKCTVSTGPPALPPHVENIEEQDYLPSSSLEIADLSGKRRRERLTNQFPEITVENINILRKESKASGKPNNVLYFAKYLLEISLKLRSQSPDKAQQLKKSLEEEAHGLLKQLASHKPGYAAAQLFLGDCYYQGAYGLKQDRKKAFSLYLKGSKLSNSDCTHRVAACYEQGAGIRKSYDYAIHFYRKTATLGNALAMYKLGLVAFKGLMGQPKNDREALSWLLRAVQVADERTPHALHELARIYEKQKTPLVIMDLDYSRELFSQAALLGYAPSQYKLGWAYEHARLNCPVDPKRSVAWYLQAAEQGHGRAALALSGWYFTGAPGLFPQSDQEAFMWARKAAEKEFADAEYAIGYYTELGIGVSRDSQEAKNWYLKASEKGDRKAVERLQALNQTDLTEIPTRNPNSRNIDCILM